MTEIAQYPYTVRDEDNEIWASFETEEEALAYGSHVANANPDKLFAVYGVIPIEREA